jgi:hypothetical protein
MNALLREMPDFTTSWWRYTMAMMRASNREISEFNDNLFIAAHIAMTAARDNPLSVMESLRDHRAQRRHGPQGDGRHAGARWPTTPSTRLKRRPAPS